MFAPTKTWRRWHRKINVTQRRYALVSALAASALPSLVLARGHRIEQVPEVPLVVDNKSIDNIDKSKRAVALLKALSANADVEKARNSRNLRSGKGKLRNRRYVQRHGPLVIYNEKGPLVKAFRNLPGVELVAVSRLNLLQLAPGGHLGRFCIWTQDAFERLDSLYGTYRTGSSEKTGYRLPRHQVSNADIDRIINSEEVKSVIRPIVPQLKRFGDKKNPLRNRQAMKRLNPAADAHIRAEVLGAQRRALKKAELLDAKRQKKPAPVDPKAVQAKKAKKASTKRAAKDNKKFVDILLSK
jgi:large subunit ribosomal protein L4e